jgi:hypothetical protein
LYFTVKKISLIFVVILLAVAGLLALADIRPGELLRNPAGVIKTLFSTADTANSPLTDSTDRLEAAPSADPQDMVAGPAKAPAQPAEPVFDLMALSKTPNLWPKSLVLKNQVTFPVLLNGKVLGFAEVPAGTKVNLAAITDGQLQLEYQGGKQTAPVESTDLVEQVKAAPRPVLAQAAPPVQTGRHAREKRSQQSQAQARATMSQNTGTPGASSADSLLPQKTDPRPPHGKTSVFGTLETN